jgi:hypothetical protein
VRSDLRIIKEVNLREISKMVIQGEPILAKKGGVMA